MVVLTSARERSIRAGDSHGDIVFWPLLALAQLTKRGLIAAVVCSDTFMKLGTAQAKVFGVPDLPLLEIKHPLGGLNMEQVRERHGENARSDGQKRSR